MVLAEIPIAAVKDPARLRRASSSARLSPEHPAGIPESTVRGLLARGDEVSVAVVDLTECVARMRGATHETADAAASMSCLLYTSRCV